MKVVVGLGEPGDELLASRGNVGAMALAALAENHGIVKFRRAQSVDNLEMADYDTMAHNSIQKVWLLKPLVGRKFVGQVLVDFFSKFQLKKSSLMVIYDDTDFDLGQLRLRDSGGTGGHPGLKSIMDALSYKDFDRIRIGIGKPSSHTRYDDFTKQRFSPEELDKAIAISYNAALAVDGLIKNGLRPTQKAYNKTGLDLSAEHESNEDKPWYPEAAIASASNREPKITILPKLGEAPANKPKIEVVKVSARKIDTEKVVSVQKMVKQTPDWMPPDVRHINRRWSADDDAVMRDMGMLPRHLGHEISDPYFSL